MEKRPMKTVLINGSPRKNWNTAALLKAAQEGAASVGAETEYIDLYDLQYTGCRSCLLCKRKGAERCRCYWKDDLSPVIERVFSADALILGSPIYLSEMTSGLLAFLERLRFCALSYDDYANYFTGRVNVGVLLTMNAPQAYYEKMFREKMESRFRSLCALNGSLEIYPCCDTLQVADYGKFSMASFNEARKKEVRETVFPKDLEAAFALGAKLSA